MTTKAPPVFRFTAVRDGKAWNAVDTERGEAVATSLRTKIDANIEIQRLMAEATPPAATARKVVRQGIADILNGTANAASVLADVAAVTPKNAAKHAVTSKATAPKVAKVTKSSLVRAEFEKGASLTEAAKATGVDPAFVWDIAKVWELKTGKRVPRSGRAPKVSTAPVVKASAKAATKKAKVTK